MRLYHGCPSPENMRQARASAPSHVHGACWTPAKMTPHDWPYFIDNGAFTDSFDRSEWLDTLDETKEKMPLQPDFVVLPDAFNDAEKTFERHRDHLFDVWERDMTPAPVVQPGLDPTMQVGVYAGMGAETLFIGGEGRWQRAYGREIIEEAHDRDLRVHIGNPGGREKLLWWARAGVDSMDTSSILQNQYWHWLEDLEGLRETPRKKAGRQTTLADGGSR